MKRLHTVAIALVLGGAVAAGLLAATRTVDLGTASNQVRLSDSAVAARTAKLDRLEHSLKKALARRPPKLPQVPRVRTSSAPVAAAPAGGGVVYVHSQPTASSSSYDDETEHESDEVEHESDD